MARGKKKKIAHSPYLSGWDDLDYLFDSLLLEPHGAALGGWTPGPEPEPQPQHHQPSGTSQETLEWLRRCREESSERRLQQQWTPRPELGWCEWCPQPRHRERDCAHAGPDYCCCCVFPDEEDELRGLLGTSAAEDSTAASGDGLPPTPPLNFAPEAGPGALPDPLPDSYPPPLLVVPAAGSESWGGMSGDDGGVTGAEEDDTPDPTCGEDGRMDPQPQVAASSPARLDGPEPAATAAGHAEAGDPATAGPDAICAAAPEATRREDPVRIRAAAASVTRGSGQAPSGGLTDSPETSTAAAPPPVPACSPGPDGAAALMAVEENGPKFLAGAPPAGRPDSPQAAPSLAILRPQHGPSLPSAVTPPPAPRTNGPRGATSARKRGMDCKPGSLQEKGSRSLGPSPPRSSLRLSFFAPDLRNRLVFDPGGMEA